MINDPELRAVLRPNEFTGCELRPMPRCERCGQPDYEPLCPSCDPEFPLTDETAPDYDAYSE